MWAITTNKVVGRKMLGVFLPFLKKKKPHAEVHLNEKKN
jgi:hypothetical protein